jgi:integrase
MIFENEKVDCIDALIFDLNRTRDWRQKMTAKYPGDPRNVRAADCLTKLAADANTLAAEDGSDWLFSHSEGLKYKQVSSRWRNLCDGSAGNAGPDNDGITPFPFHSLRHRYAVDYLKTPLPEGRTPGIYVLSTWAIRR